MCPRAEVIDAIAQSVKQQPQLLAVNEDVGSSLLNR
jgi:hypothetical protein